MKLLLDTHIALWSISDDHRLSKTARELLDSQASELYVSAASIFEIAIKNSLPESRSKIDMSAEAAARTFQSIDMILLPILPKHAAAVESFPAYHGDPFDRLLVAQALSEPLILITHDKDVAAYSDTFILV